MKESSGLKLAALLFVLAVIAAAAYIMVHPASEKPRIGENEPGTSELLRYDNTKFGVAFLYPESYVLTEQDVGNQGERTHHAVTLVKKSDSAVVPEGGEGPTAITLDIFDDGIDRQGLERWIKNTSASNYKIALSEELSTTTVSGASAYAYTWDGLFRGDSVVFAHGKHIYMWSVTYMDSAAPIRDDFAAVLSSIELRSKEQ